MARRGGTTKAISRGEFCTSWGDQQRSGRLQKKSREHLGDARLSRFYGFAVLNLTPADKLILQANMPVLLAEEELRKGASDSRIYDLVLAMTGSKDRAADALTARMAARRDRGEKFGER